MSDSLRERIATVLLDALLANPHLVDVVHKFDDPNDVEVAIDCLPLAGAVIAKLGLTPEHSYGTTYPKVPVTDQKFVRYVTDWEILNEQVRPWR